jgi:SAM-dependent methyltransferase
MDVSQAQHENEHWSAVFSKEKRDASEQLYSSYWWQDYYHEMKSIICLPDAENKILELGSGSGKASFEVSNNKSLIKLVDISDEALKYATHLSEKYSKRTHTVVQQSDIFQYKDLNTYDLVWNIGLIEHYPINDIEKIIKVMLSLTKKAGITAFAYPNKWSGPTIKAWVMRFLPKRIFKGYRLDSEKFYSDKTLVKKVEIILAEKGLNKNVSIIKIGNPLPMETPEFILKTLGKYIHRSFQKNRFLTVITITEKS